MIPTSSKSQKTQPAGFHVAGNDLTASKGKITTTGGFKEKKRSNKKKILASASSKNNSKTNDVHTTDEYSSAKVAKVIDKNRTNADFNRNKMQARSSTGRGESSSRISLFSESSEQDNPSAEEAGGGLRLASVFDITRGDFMMFTIVDLNDFL